MIPSRAETPWWGLAVTLTVVTSSLVVGGYRLFEGALGRIREARLDGLSAISALKTSQIVSWRHERLGDARIHSTGPFREGVLRWLGARSDATLRAALWPQLCSLREVYHYSNLILASPAGDVLLSLDSRLTSLEGQSRELVARAEASRAPVLGELFRCPTSDKIHVGAAAPILDSNGRPVAVLILLSDARDFLYPLVQSWPTRSRTAETELVRRNGQEALFLNDLRHRSGTALTLRSPLTDRRSPEVQAVLGRAGPFEGPDYRGVPVLAWLRPVPDTPWCLIAKVDAAEMLAEARYDGWVTGVVVLLGTILTLALIALAASRRKMGLYRMLLAVEQRERQVQDEIRSTLYAIGDGVITTDSSGRVTHMNRVAEELTAWLEPEATGRALTEVFTVVDPVTRTRADGPDPRALREGRIVGLANRALLIARDGRERPIADSAAPIRDAGSNVIGAVLVFRDVTEADRYEREREATLRLMTLLNCPNRTREFIQSLTRFLQEWTGCEAVGVRLREGDDFPYFETRGFPPEFVHLENHLCERDPDGQLLRDPLGNPVLVCMCGNILRGRFDPRLPFFTAKGSFWTNGTTQLLASVAEVDLQARTRNKCNTSGYESVALIRLRHGEEILGLIQLNDRAPGRFSADKIRFLENVSDQIAIALAHRLAQAELEQTARLYRSLFDNVVNGLAYCRMVSDGDRPPDFVYLAVNHAFEKLTGLKNVTGRRVTEVIPGVCRSVPGLLELYGRVAASGKPERVETYVESLAMWLSLSVYSPHEEHFVVIIEVITERKRAETALLESEARFRSLVRLAPVALCFVRSDGTLDHLNEHFVRLFGYTSADIPTLEEWWTSAYPDQTYRQWVTDAWKNAVARAVHEGTDIEPIEYDVTCKDGTVRVVEISGVTLGDGLLASFIDLTARKKAAREYAMLQAQLIQSQKMEAIGRLAGGIAHDFRNQLTVIKGFGEVLAAESLTIRDGPELLHEILKAVQRATDITARLLAFSRQEPLRPEPRNLAELIHDIGRALKRIIGEDIRLSIPSCERSCVALVDASQFQQAILNLATNARDAMPQGGQLEIRIDRLEADAVFVETRPDMPQGSYTVVTVRDTGSGMNERTRMRIFEPFFTTKPVGKGTGLGLSMVRGFVLQSGGRIEVESQPGQGSTFHVFFPCPPATAVRPSTLGTMEALPGGTETILVVEDEEAVRHLLLRTLRSLGYTVLEATNAEHALSLVDADARGVDILVTDVVMPGLTGADLSQLIRAVRPDLPVLYVTGYAGVDLTARGVTESSNVLPKPFTKAGLATRVRALLDGTEPQPDPPVAATTE